MFCALAQGRHLWRRHRDVFITPRVKRHHRPGNEGGQPAQGRVHLHRAHLPAILSERNTAVARILSEAGITKERVYDTVKDIRGGQRVTDPQAETRYRTLEKYSRDLTTMAKAVSSTRSRPRPGDLRVIQILSRRTKNNPVLIGEAGVGKTAIVEGLAQKISSNDVPEILTGKRVISLDLGAMIAGSLHLSMAAFEPLFKLAAEARARRSWRPGRAR